MNSMLSKIEFWRPIASYWGKTIFPEFDIPSKYKRLSTKQF